jgi:hypothetical protein
MKAFFQNDASDCSPACLAMIAGHYGRQVSMTQMRQRAGTDRNSTRLKGLFGRFLPTLKPHVGTTVNTVVAIIVLPKSSDLSHCTGGLPGMH